MSSLLEKKTGPFYHAFEAFNEEQKREYTRVHLAKIVDLARTTPFYKTRISDLKFHFDDAFPLKNLSPLTSADLRAGLPPASTDLVSRPETSITVFQSGGTTGTPKTSLFTFEEMEIINECNARGFYAVGLNAQDRVANLWAVGGLYMTFIHMNRMLMEYGCMSFPFSNKTPTDFIFEVAKLFNINCFTGITSVVLSALREIHKKPHGNLKVDKIFFGGEHIYESDRQEMKDKFGVELIKAPGYGTVDSWYLGYQCALLPNGVFHAFEDMVHLEIVDENEKRHCNPAEIGMMYATPYHRRLTPILRYRVGDHARWLPEPCRCGRTTRLFELLGRGDDVLRVGYDSVDYDFIQNLVARIEGASSRIQMQKKRIGGKDQLILRIESSRPSEAAASMTQELTNLFYQERPSFREFVKSETICPLVVEWLAEGALPVNSRTGKLVRVIDSL